jgi:hypothetical protein
MHPATLTHHRLIFARQIVTSPARYAAQPALRTFAWEELLGQRGKTVHEPRLRQLAQTPQARPTNPAPPRLVTTTAIPHRAVAAILAGRMQTAPGAA